MEEKKKKAHPVRTVLLVLLAIIVLIAASPFIYSLIGGFRDYDDVDALAASGGAMPLSVDENGIVSFSADKAAVYSYVSGVQLEKQLSEYVAQLPFCSEKTVTVSKVGYKLGGETLSLSVKLRLFGFLPVQLHAEADMVLSPDELYIKLNELKYGKWIRFPLDEIAASFDMPELTDGFVIDTSDFYGELCPVSLSAKDDVLSVRCDILNRIAGNAGDPGILLAKLMPIVCGEDHDAARVLRGDTAEVYGSIKDSADLSGLLTGLLKFGYETNGSNFKQTLEATPLLGLKIGDVSVCVSGYSASVSEKLSRLEAELTALRDSYKELNFRISENGLSTSDGTPAEAVLPEEWGAKTVLQYNIDYNSIVKASDGTRSISGDWIVLPNPKLSDLARDRGVTLPNIPGITVFDLTVAFRSADGTPAIMFLTAADELGINIISEELYNEIVSCEGLPVYCSSDIISPNSYQFVCDDPSQRVLRFYTP